jgi:hypothetical protein
MTGGGLNAARRLWCAGCLLDGQPPDHFLQGRVPPPHQLRHGVHREPVQRRSQLRQAGDMHDQRNGDLIYRMYLQATLPQVQLLASDGSGAQFRWLNWVGHNLIRLR